jgi:nucleotide-binding universal stress UspA family protein
MQSRPLKKILWAIDAFDRPETQEGVIQTLKAMSQRTQCEILPLFALSPAQARVSPAYVPLWGDAFKALAEKRMAELLQKSDLPRLSAPEILIEKSDPSLRTSVERVLKKAGERGCDAIAVATHARKGLNRFLLGSFAETLILQSHIPVLAVNPGAHAPQVISKILYPTEFNQAARDEFEHVVRLGLELGAKVTLYYKEPPLGGDPSMVAPVSFDYLEQQAEVRKEVAQTWVSWAAGLGAKVTAEFDNQPGNVVDALTDYAATEKFDLIAMVSQASRVTAVMLGSVSRQVLRQAPCPVWVQHSLK